MFEDLSLQRPHVAGLGIPADGRRNWRKGCIECHAMSSQTARVIIFRQIKYSHLGKSE